MTHLEAAQIVRAVWLKVHGREPTSAELVLFLAVAWLESQYGRASGQHAVWAAQGLYTWGNLEVSPVNGECPAGTYPGKDGGNARCFYLSRSDEEAAEAMLRNMTKLGDPASTVSRTRAFGLRTRGILAAFASGSPEELAKAMQTPPEVAYYEAPYATYAAAIRKHAGVISAAIGAVVALPGASSGLLPLLVVVGGGIATYLLTRKQRLRF